MEFKHIFVIFILLSLIASCQPVEQNNQITEVIQIDPDDFVNQVGSGEEWVETMKFIPLETPKGEYIPDDAKTKRRGDYWIFGNFDMLLVFDKDGDFVSSIKTQGKGPAEYSYIFDYDLTPDTEEIVISGGKEMVFYSINGQFIEKKPIPLRPFGIAALGEDYFAFSPERWRQGREDSVGKYQMLITNRQGEIIERHFEFPYYLLNDSWSEFIRSTDEGNLFVLSYDLNIYEAGPGLTLKKKYTIDFGNLNPDTSFLQDARVENNREAHKFNEGKMTKPWGLAETSNTLLLRCGSEKHQKVAFRLINRKSGNHRTVVMDDPPKLGYFHGWPIYPYLLSTGDWIYHLMNPMEVLELMDQLSDDQKKSLSKCEGFENLKNVKEYDNSVIVMYKMKDF